MNDPKIRQEFRTQYLDHIQGSCLIVDELGILQGKSIIDIAAITPQSLEGFEIKSASDTLYRLPGQIKRYNEIFDYISLVTEDKYLKKVEDLIPAFWGIILTQESSLGDVKFTYYRHPTQNFESKKRKVAELLWKGEACQFLYENNIRGISKLRRGKLWDLIADKFTHEQIRRAVYIALKRRVNWK